jgi:nucleotide-binding universal stress UspA family protein
MLLVFVAQELVATAVLRAQEDLELAQELARRLEASGRRYLEELRERLVHEGARVRTLVVRSANERQSILDLSNAERSDLVVLSAHGAVCNPASTFGSVTSQLINDSVVPLLVLQDLRDTELRGRDGDRSAPPLRACYPEGL